MTPFFRSFEQELAAKMKEQGLVGFSRIVNTWSELGDCVGIGISGKKEESDVEEILVSRGPTAQEPFSWYRRRLDGLEPERRDAVEIVEASESEDGPYISVIHMSEQ